MRVLVSLILLQAGATLPPVDFDLARLEASASSCAPGGSGGEIVVCAGSGSHNRLPPLADRADAGLPKAEIGLFGKVRGSVGVQQNGVGGFPSNRVMVTVKIPF